MANCGIVGAGFYADPSKHLHDPTVKPLYVKTSHPIFSRSSFFLAKKSRSKIFVPDFFKQLNFLGRFFPFVGNSSRKKCLWCKVHAEKMTQLESVTAKNRGHVKYDPGKTGLIQSMTSFFWLRFKVCDLKNCFNVGYDLGFLTLINDLLTEQFTFVVEQRYYISVPEP